MHSNIYEYLCDRLEDMPHILLLCGADRRYTNENSSDFEKFRELCLSLVKLSGSSIYRDVNLAVSELFGENIDITQKYPEQLWKRFYGECEDMEVITPVLTLKTAYADKFTSLVDISQATEFIVPDKYHVGLAREKLANGQKLTGSEKNMLIIQELREAAQSCINSSYPLVIRADCPTEITLRVIHYLKTCNLLTDILVLVSLNRLDAKLSELFDTDRISLGVFVDKCDESLAVSMQHLSRIYSVGNIVWILENDNPNDFYNTADLLLEVWKAEYISSENCLLNFREICKFY